MKLFEYKVVEYNSSVKEKIEKKLNDLGNKGWELISSNIEQRVSANDCIFIFKREK